MKPLTSKQIKFGWIVAAILVFVHFLPGMSHSFMETIALHRSNMAGARVVSLPVSPVKHVRVDAEEVPSMGPAFPPEAQARFLGVWNGTQMGNNNCQVHLELRASPYKPGYVAGYETRICYDLAKFVANRSNQGGLAEALKAKSPLATELEGSFSAGDLTFRVANSIGGSDYTCPLSSYAVMPWGAQDVIAQWKASGGCPDGQMILKRGRE